VDVDHGGLIITWISDSTDLWSLEAVSASVVDGTAQPVGGDGRQNSTKWRFPTTATIRLTFDIPSSTRAKTFTLFGQEVSTLPGRTGAPVYYPVQIVPSLPATGGPPAADGDNAREMMVVGAALLLAAAACVVVARRLRTGESI